MGNIRGRQMKLRDNDRKGFTLIEATFAIVLLGVAASSVLLPFASGAAMHVESARITLAANLAADKLEDFVNTDYDELDFLDFFEFEGSVTDASGNVFSDPAYADFSWYAVFEDRSVANVDLQWVTVYVYDNDVYAVKMSVLLGP
ncbi:MAG: type II secretion system protein [Planctomycetes bacterium]|nr:type II secretion system protein [Planctomycetota bacterium]